MATVNKNNPSLLSIGQRIFAERRCTLEYDGNSQRVVVKHYLNEWLWVCGVVHRYTGTVYGGGGWSPFGDDPDPPALTGKKRVVLYECRTGINAKPILIHPEDITAS